VFAYAAAQVKNVLEVTHELGGVNYVLWGGREGYETLLNTDLKRELDQYGRFLSMVVDHKKKIGFKGTILIEPKPREPTKHQYDFDVASVYGFLKRYGLENEVKVNIEANHATLAGHSFEHEIALAEALGIFGSIDMNRGDAQLGWDTDQFPNNIPEIAYAMYHIVQGGGFTTGGLNFDAKIRRPVDRSRRPTAWPYRRHGCRRARAADRGQDDRDGALTRHVKDRYAAWDSPEGKAILSESDRWRTWRRGSRRRMPSRSRAPASRSILRTCVNSYM
jgi:xylose isomerase